MPATTQGDRPSIPLLTGFPAGSTMSANLLVPLKTNSVSVLQVEGAKTSISTLATLEVAARWSSPQHIQIEGTGGALVR